MIERVLLWLFGSILGDSVYPEQVNDKKLGMAIAGSVFTIFMLVKMPEGWEMWATYIGAVGGWNVASYGLKKNAEKKQESDDAKP